MEKHDRPACPDCGRLMVRRRGHNEFWGCQQYPKCRATITITRQPLGIIRGFYSREDELNDIYGYDDGCGGHK